MCARPSACESNFVSGAGSKIRAPRECDRPAVRLLVERKNSSARIRERGEEGLRPSTRQEGELLDPSGGVMGDAIPY